MKFSFSIFLLLLLIILSGCAGEFNNKMNNLDSAWEYEILMSEECGMDGLSCCLDKEEMCSYGQTCCFDPSNDKLYYCADECSFGEEDNFCRSTEPKCDEGLVCNGQQCVVCGKEGNICCTGESKCFNDNAHGNTRTECVNNKCSACGYNGKSACKSGAECNSAHFLNDSKCLSCGGFNKPCCKEGSGVDYECNPSSDLKCNLGFCS